MAFTSNFLLNEDGVFDICTLLVGFEEKTRIPHTVSRSRNLLALTICKMSTQTVLRTGTARSNMWTQERRKDRA